MEHELVKKIDEKKRLAKSSTFVERLIVLGLAASEEIERREREKMSV